MGEWSVYPLTAERWEDFTALFGPRGASSGCWCMFWRLPNKEWQDTNGKQRCRMMRNLVDGGAVPGLLGYLDGVPVGWISLAPRPEYVRIEQSRSEVYRRLDGAPVWSVVCFFIDAKQRRKGVGLRLLQAGIEYARAQGATLLEAYPKEVAGRAGAGDIFVGVPSLFAAAGFSEVARPKPDRPVMRLVLEESTP